VKYNRYHDRLIAPLWPPVFSAVRETAGELSDILGDDHDPAVLRRANNLQSGREAAERLPHGRA
jgi:hypothetical protein